MIVPNCPMCFQRMTHAQTEFIENDDGKRTKNESFLCRSDWCTLLERAVFVTVCEVVSERERA